ncbi:MAG: conjugative transposon protein TraM [Bacteroides sp.]|nr:conjugative transposon protein TraM [Bacteroides sp.]
MGRGLIQGTSQFVSKKLREVKVNLKAGYRVFLLPNEK